MLIATMLFIGCGKDYVSMGDTGTSTRERRVTGGSDTTAGGQVSPETVLFKRDLQPILRNNCLRCHDSGDKFPCDDKHSYTSIVVNGYSNTTDPENSKFFRNSFKGHPDDYLTPSEHDLFVTWMLEGALNN